MKKLSNSALHDLACFRRKRCLPVISETDLNKLYIEYDCNGENMSQIMKLKQMYLPEYRFENKEDSESKWYQIMDGLSDHERFVLFVNGLGGFSDIWRMTYLPESVIMERIQSK